MSDVKKIWVADEGERYSVFAADGDGRSFWLGAFKELSDANAFAIQRGKAENVSNVQLLNDAYEALKSDLAKLADPTFWPTHDNMSLCRLYLAANDCAECPLRGIHGRYKCFSMPLNVLDGLGENRPRRGKYTEVVASWVSTVRSQLLRQLDEAMRRVKENKW